MDSPSNVTLPHKIAALKGVDTLDDVARRTGAVNTVIVKDDGTLHGFNTDVFGFMAWLSLMSTRMGGGAGPAVVLGGGRTPYVWLFKMLVCQIRILNRTTAKPRI